METVVMRRNQQWRTVEPLEPAHGLNVGVQERGGSRILLLGWRDGLYMRSYFLVAGFQRAVMEVGVWARV